MKKNGTVNQAFGSLVNDYKSLWAGMLTIIVVFERNIYSIKDNNFSQIIDQVFAKFLKLFKRL